MNCMKYPNPPIADCNSCDPWKALGPTGPTGDKGSDGEFVGLPGLIGTMNDDDAITLVCNVLGGRLFINSEPPFVPWVTFFWGESSPGQYLIEAIIPRIPMMSLLGEGEKNITVWDLSPSRVQLFKNDPANALNNQMVMADVIPGSLTQNPAGGGRNIALLYQSMAYVPIVQPDGGTLTLHLRPIIY